MASLSIVSYNCRGLPRSSSTMYTRPSVELLLNNDDIDILCFQETWYNKQQFSQLNVLHDSFHGIGVRYSDYV